MPKEALQLAQIETDAKLPQFDEEHLKRARLLTFFYEGRNSGSVRLVSFRTLLYNPEKLCRGLKQQRIFCDKLLARIPRKRQDEFFSHSNRFNGVLAGSVRVNHTGRILLPQFSSSHQLEPEAKALHSVFDEAVYVQSLPAHASP
jgi:hypothetical protein